ncbi:MAG: Ferrochelatase [Planctomycetes bacterium]|nr:Ferrochelatase [Planctomycetota bacterium]
MRGVLLVNLGTPDRPDMGAVRRYLREFLSDPRVIDIPGPARWALVNLVICPFRAPKSAHAYRQVWTDAGSPLLVHGLALRDALRTRLGAPVELGMRYGNPSIAAAMDALDAAGADRVTVLPLFPQYASSSWGSAVEAVHAEAARRLNVPALTVVPPYFDHEAFVAAQAAVAAPALAELRPDRVLMSYHGLPERQVRASDTSGRGACLAAESCCARMTAANRYCYRAQCYATSRALASALGLAEGSWEVAFQSRLGRTPWIRPYTDERIAALAASGVRRLAVLVPSFTADCLETLEEIAIRARDQFMAAGGEAFAAVPCVNAHPAWVEGAARLVGDAVKDD